MTKHFCILFVQIRHLHCVSYDTYFTRYSQHFLQSLRLLCCRETQILPVLCSLQRPLEFRTFYCSLWLVAEDFCVSKIFKVVNTLVTLTVRVRVPIGLFPVFRNLLTLLWASVLNTFTGLSIMSSSSRSSSFKSTLAIPTYKQDC